MSKKQHFLYYLWRTKEPASVAQCYRRRRRRNRQMRNIHTRLTRAEDEHMRTRTKLCARLEV